MNKKEIIDLTEYEGMDEAEILAVILFPKLKDTFRN